MNYAEVAVNSPGAQRRTFCYAVPSDIKVGQAVWAPFGPRVVQGIVFRLTEFPSVEETKEIVGLIDPRPILSSVQIELARWLSERYLAPLFDTAALMMPPGFERRMITYIRALIGASEINDSSLTPHQRKLLSLLKRKEKVAIAEVEKALGRKEAGATIGQLVRKNLVTKTQELERAKVRPKMLPYIRLAVGSDVQQEAEHLVGMRRALKQAKLLEYLMA
jgi:primosomal protein N' (replication factor Y)